MALRKSSLIFSALVLLSFSAFSQTPGQNTNMVSGTQFPGGDPFLQRQNEPSVAISTRNPRHMLAGANDYRTVDLPAQDALPDDAVTGDAWLGVFKSFDGGQTWTSTLLPGFPQDNSPLGTASPLKGFSTAADPVVRAGTNGLFYYSGVAFNRGTNQGVVFVSRFIDLNNKENGNVVAGTDAIKYVSAFVVDRGSAGQFLDKPWIAVDVPRNNATCTIQVPNGNSTTPQTVPAGNVYLAYTVLVGNDQNIRTKLYLSRSVDCGATWSTPTKLSEGLPVNQGASVAVDPSTGYVYVVWRGFATVNTPNTINIVRSTDGGSTFTKASTIKSLPSYSDASPSAPAFFDQGTTATSFRTNAFPAMTVDGSGRVYVAWSQRGIGPGGDARIVVTSSSDFVTWTTPKAVDNADLSDDAHVTFSRGHQFMPSFTFSDGRLMLLYYDERFDHTVGLFNPNNPFAPGADGRFYTERRDKRGELTSNPGAVYTPFVSDFGLTQMRHTVEVRVAQGVPGADPSFTTARVSQYKFGTRGDETGTVGDLQQLQINPPNLPLFQQGSVPFIGDYIDIAGLTMKKTASGWAFNTALTPSPVHIATFTSNQDVRPPLDGNWTHYTPIGVGGPSLYNPGVNKPVCQVGQEGMRNQNIYASVITQGLLVSSQQNSKPLSTTVPRQFVITVQNATNFDKSFRLAIGNQPSGGVATFTPIPNPIPNPLPSPSLTLDVSVAAHSGIARSVYALSTSPFASIAVNVNEINAPGGTSNNGLSSFVTLNADPTVAGLTDPDGGSGVGISTAEIYNPNVSNPNVSNPNVSNPNVSNPNVSNPNVSNPNVSNPNVSNPNVSNPDLANPNVSNPNVSNPNVSNPNVSNPNVSNPNVSNTTLEDGTYTVTNNGNTSGSYTVKLVGNAPAGTPLQLIISKPYGNPISQNCVLFEQSNNVLLSNVNNPIVLPPTNLSDPRITVPDINNPTISLAPGETALVTIRGNFGTLDPDTAKQKMIDILGNLSPVIVAHAPNTNDPTNTPTYAAVLPDLLFDTISNSPKSPTSTDKVTITAVIRNAGGATAPASTALLRLSGDRSAQAFDVPSLAPGATFEISQTFSGLGGGQFTATATADSGNTVTELSEDNNVATDTFAVTPVLGLTFDPAAQDFYTAGFANTVTVLATDAFGNPVPNAQLGFLQSWDGATQTAVTDPTGHATFTFTGPPVGDGYVITITGSAPGFAQGTLTKTFSTIPQIG